MLNTSNALDALLAVNCLFYRIDGVEGELGLIFGARELQASQGQILPHALEPGKSYFVEGRAHFSIETELGKFVLAGTNSDFVLTCRFVFNRARQIVIRLHPFDDPKKIRRLPALITELRMLMHR